MNKGLFPLLVSLLLLTAGAARARASERVVYTISVGNNAPPVGDLELPVLRYADDDAVRYYEVLRLASRDATLLSVLDRRTQERFPDAAKRSLPPTLVAFEHALSRVRAKMRIDVAEGRRPVLFLTFSGHGAIDPLGEPFLAFADGNLTRSQLHEQILPSLVEGQVHLIVDACHAEAALGVRGAFDHEASGTTVALSPRESSSLLQERTLSRFPNVGAIVATSSEQEAHEWARIESGVFTHEVLSALLGAADVNGDLRVEYSEVEAFVAAANRNVQDPRARPRVKSHPPRADERAVLMDLTELKSVVLLRGRAGELGRFHVELDNGLRWLEAHLSGDLSVTLALPRARRAHLRTSEREAVVPARADASLAELRFSPLHTAARGSVDEAYRNDLFSVAYGPAYYDGYVDSAGLLGVTFGSRAPRRDVVRPRSKHKAFGIFALSVAGGALVAGGVFTGLAVRTKREFDDANVMRTASELSRRFERESGLALGCAGLTALSAGIGALLFWRARVVVESDGRGATALLSLQH